MVNAQQYLDNNYPETERWGIEKLDLSNKNLEGSLDLNDFFSLREIRVSNNPQLGEIMNKPWGATSYFSAQEWLIRKHHQRTNKKIKLEHGEQIEGELIIDDFPQLEEIEFWRSDLIKLKIKNCSQLIELNCGSDKLTNLEIVNCPQLKFNYGNVRSDSLKKLELKELEKITHLNLANSGLTEAKIENCPILEKIGCQNSKLIKLEISNLEKLNSLDCSNNQITKLELKAFPDLKEIYCFKNKLTNLDVSGCKKLETLYCSNNKLNNLNASDCLVLRKFEWLNNSELVSLDISGCQSLEELCCQNNKLIDLNLSKCLGLKKLHCFNNQLNKLDLKDCFNLDIVDCNNSQLTELKLDGLKNLTRLNCEKNLLTELDVRDCLNLEELNCEENRLNKLDLGELENLIELKCRNNQLTELYLDNCPNLERLNCSSNLLTNLELGFNTELHELNLNNNKFQNQILSFLSHLIKLKQLELKDNQFIGSLRIIKNLSELKKFDISNTNIESGWEYLSDNLEEFFCSSEEGKGQKIEEIKNALRGRTIAVKDYCTYNYGYTSTTNPNYASYPNYQYSSQDPSDCNFVALLKNWKQANPDKIRIVQLTKEGEEKEVQRLKNELALERDHAKNMDNFYRQNPPSENISLQIILEKISDDYLKIEQENKRLKKENKKLEKVLELTERIFQQELENKKNLFAKELIDEQIDLLLNKRENFQVVVNDLNSNRLQSSELKQESKIEALPK